MTQCIPIRDLKNTAAISEKVADMVIMSAEVYDRIRLYTVYEKLMEAENDIIHGKTADAAASLTGIRSKYGL